MKSEAQEQKTQSPCLGERVGRFKSQFLRGGAYFSLITSVLLAADIGVRYVNQFIELPLIAWVFIAMVCICIIAFIDNKMKVINGEIGYLAEKNDKIMETLERIKNIEKLIENNGRESFDSTPNPNRTTRGNSHPANKKKRNKR